jgi:hypothetical protein
MTAVRAVTVPGMEEGGGGAEGESMDEGSLRRSM